MQHSWCLWLLCYNFVFMKFLVPFWFYEYIWPQIMLMVFCVFSRYVEGQFNRSLKYEYVNRIYQSGSQCSSLIKLTICRLVMTVLSIPNVQGGTKNHQESLCIFTDSVSKLLLCNHNCKTVALKRSLGTVHSLFLEISYSQNLPPASLDGEFWVHLRS